MTATATDPAQLFRAEDIDRLPAGSGDQLIYCSFTGMTRVLPRLQVQILERCKRFATLDQHAAQACNKLKLGSMHVSATRTILAEMVESGLLVSMKALTDRVLNGTVADDPVPAISSLGIPTCNRPQELERSLRSYAQCSQLYGRPINFLVADQSADENTQATNRQMISCLQKELAIKVFYAGLEEKKEFVQHLSAHAGVPLDVVSFALLNDEKCAIATGANRNALLLSTLGEVTMQADDDTICRLAPARQSSPGLALVSKYHVSNVFFPGEEESKSLGNNFKVEDVFALHEQLLGKSLSNCVIEVANGNPDLQAASPAFFGKSNLGSGRVGITAMGLAGDSGVGTSHFYLYSDGEERSSLIRAESDYRHSMYRDVVINSVSRATISDVAFCTGINIGLDNRAILPPFMPVQRGQDCLFSMLIHSCSVSLYSGFLPWVVSHRRRTPSMYTQAHMQEQVGRLRSRDIIMTLVRLLAPKPAFNDVRKNLTVLGKSLREWGSVPLADFENLVRVKRLDDISGQMAALEVQLKKHDRQPSYWADDVNFCLGAFREAMTDDLIVVAQDLQADFGVEAARILMQRLVRRFGELLQYWPSLCEAARELGARGIKLGKEV
jgi:hypothetical protein